MKYLLAIAAGQAYAPQCPQARKTSVSALELARPELG